MFRLIIEREISMESIESRIHPLMLDFCNQERRSGAKVNYGQRDDMATILISYKKIPDPPHTTPVITGLMNLPLPARTSMDGFTPGYHWEMPLLPKAKDKELDDEYLPACCRNGRPHSHPV